MRTRAELLAQLENEQASGDPAWRAKQVDGDLNALLTVLARDIAPLLDGDLPQRVRPHGSSRPLRVVA